MAKIFASFQTVTFKTAKLNEKKLKSTLKYFFIWI